MHACHMPYSCSYPCSSAIQNLIIIAVFKLMALRDTLVYMTLTIGPLTNFGVLFLCLAKFCRSCPIRDKGLFSHSCSQLLHRVSGPVVPVSKFEHGTRAQVRSSPDVYWIWHCPGVLSEGLRSSKSELNVFIDAYSTSSLKDPQNRARARAPSLNAAFCFGI